MRSYLYVLIKSLIPRKCRPLLRGALTKARVWVNSTFYSKMYPEALTEKNPVDFTRSIVGRIKRSGKSFHYKGPVSSCYAWLSKHGIAIQDLSQTEMGAALAREMDSTGLFANPPYYACINHATILPGSATIIASDGTILNDEIDFVRQHYGMNDLKLPCHNWLRNNHILLKYTIHVTPTLECGIHLFKEYEQNYFHFLFEAALKLFLLEKEKLVPTSVPLLIADDLSKQLYELIELIKHPDRRIIKLKPHVPYLVKHLHYLSDLSRIVDAYGEVPSKKFTFLSASLMANLAQHVKTLLGEDNNIARRKLFLTRSGVRRSLVNQQDLIRQILGHGFEMASLEMLDLKSQVRILSEASVVVGATGAAFTNLLWCAPGTKVLILYPDHPLNNRTFWDCIGNAMGLDIHYLDGERQGSVVAKYGIHDDFKIDAAALDASVGSYLSSLVQ